MTTATYAPTTPVATTPPQLQPYGIFGDLLRTVAPIAGQAIGGFTGSPHFGSQFGSAIGSVASVLPFAASPMMPQPTIVPPIVQQALTQQAIAQQALTQHVLAQQAIAQQQAAQLQALAQQQAIAQQQAQVHQQALALQQALVQQQPLQPYGVVSPLPLWAGPTTSPSVMPYLPYTHN